MKPLFPLSAMRVVVVDAQRQMRTPRDVKVAWVRPRVPPKRAGRSGTRRGWKRKNPPHWLLAYREPDDVLVLHGETIIATPRQAHAIAMEAHQGTDPQGLDGAAATARVATGDIAQPTPGATP